eukprot:m.599370 g.599370  ORF g.599370 m.599370 type:complete len:722 (+) comp58079_c0_seq5:29-2194(+)
MAYRGVECEERAEVGAATALDCWSLAVARGRQVWTHVDSPAKVENPAAARYFVGLTAGAEVLADPREIVEDSIRSGLAFFSAIQTEDGHWAGDYGGPMFLLPGYAISTYITGVEIPEAYRKEIVRYLSNMQSADGGWGIHIESLSTVFGTALTYVTLRILGVPREDSRCVKARTWLRERGGCLGIPSWGKFWLAILNVYSWDGVHSLFPEMILLPSWFPLHTRRLWCYCRTVYMPMTYLYGRKFQAPEDDLIKQLREELIFQPFATVNWKQARSFIAKEDLYTPHTFFLEAFFSAVNLYEKVAPTWLRNMALRKLYDLIQKEDQFTNFIDIGPVNKTMNMLCVYLVEGPQSSAFKQHVERLPDYLWMGRDGMKMNGTNGSQLWDTAFTIQVFMECRLKHEFKDVLRKAHDFIDVSQIRVNHPEHERYYRSITKGGWPFSTHDMGWIVADCTGEGLKAALLSKKHHYTDKPLSDDRFFDAVNIILVMQNSTGGWSTCEENRGWHFFEWFNASEVFGEIMIDYDYVECSSSALQALCVFREMYPQHRTREVNAAIDNAAQYILRAQRADGSWEGMWGVCFTYGAWFAIEGLIDAGIPHTHPSIQRGCKYLLSKQRPDGGWGETFMSCVTREYVQHPRAQVVNTAWALLSLLKAEYPAQEEITRGIRLLMSRQLVTGDWKQESISGVFNKNCMISYSNYKNIFPLWALTRFMDKYPQVTRVAAV